MLDLSFTCVGSISSSSSERATMYVLAASLLGDDVESLLPADFFRFLGGVGSTMGELTVPSMPFKFVCSFCMCVFRLF